VYDILNSQIESLNNAGKTLGEIEDIKDSVIQSDLTMSQKSEMLETLREISFKKGIELDFPNEYSKPRSNSETLGKNASEVVENTESEGSVISELGNESTLEEVRSRKDRIGDLFDEKSKNLLLDYKRYYLFILENTGCPEKTVIIHDSIPAPELVRRVLTKFDTAVYLKDFLQQLEDPDSELRKFSNICLLIISNLSEDTRRLLELKDALGGFDNFKYCELMPINDGFKPYEYEGEKLFEALKSDIYVSLTNADIDKAEESLIKRFFPSESSFVRYKLLKGGLSGSKVVEVSQVLNVASPCKFVIKIGSREGKKIAQEETAVKRWVSNRVPDYQTERKENATHEALKYNFASKDGKRDSISFGEYFAKNNSDKIKTIVEKLFSQKLFEEWEGTQSKTNDPITIFDLYKDFLDKDKIFQAVNIIAFDKAEETIELITKILGVELPRCVKKACHGDLHSENVIIDDEHVFLIDFGMTGIQHCFLDYSTLEASIRLKLTPSYYPTSVLRDADSDFLFNFDVTDAALTTKIENTALKKSYEVISKVRAEAIKKVRGNQETYSDNDELELNYLVSLFCIVCRNLKYQDLNQKYALNLCNDLAQHILKRVTIT
jgi:hypothetical protein